MSPLDLLPPWGEELYAEESPRPSKPPPGKWWHRPLAHARWLGGQISWISKATMAGTAALYVGVKFFGLGFVPQTTYREDQKVISARMDTLNVREMAWRAAYELRLATLEVRFQDHLDYSTDTNAKTQRMYARLQGGPR